MTLDTPPILDDGVATRPEPDERIDDGFGVLPDAPSFDEPSTPNTPNGDVPPERPMGPGSNRTSLRQMYDFFLAGITDDMFMELTKEDTEEILDEILMAALPSFEFPRKNVFDIDWGRREFRCAPLTAEEMMIIRQYMIVEWIGYQLASIENVRQKYSSSDFSFTSQASHMARLITLRKEYSDKGFHLQRLYCRRTVDEDGRLVSTMDSIMASGQNSNGWKRRFR